MRGLIAMVLVLGLAACATRRGALQPSTTTSTPASVALSPVSGPMSARTLARRLGLACSDADSHVLLSDEATRVRIWKDSNELSISGETVRLDDRTKRRGRTLMVPGSMVDYVEARVGQQRKSLRAPVRRPRQRTVTTALALPTLPSPKPAAFAPTPEPAQVPTRTASGAEPGWQPSGSARTWKWIVLHHSDDRKGNFARYDRIHRETNGWDECGYHFVIGNGSLSGDGQIEVGSRWYKQKHGAHCKTPDNRFNDHGVGICLVGNFETDGPPTRAQMDAVVRLCRWLMARFDIPLGSVIGHCDCKPTACPGRYFPWDELRERIARPTR